LIVISCSLDSSLAQAATQGTLQQHRERYELFSTFDKVTILTQDTHNFSSKLGKVTHVPCAKHKIKKLQTITSRIKYLRWLQFAFNSFHWLLINRNQINVVISENVDSPIPVLFITFFRIPYFIHYHYDVAAQVGKINKSHMEGILLSTLERLGFRKATAVWVTAKSLALKAETLGAKKVTVIPNWIDFSKSRERTNIGEKNKKKIAFVGRLHPVKQVPLLLQAFQKVAISDSNIQLTVVGDGDERKNLETLSRELGIERQVVFTGFKDRDDVFSILSESELLVLPSKMEGNPRVLIEAMMLKVPIVATKVPGIVDMIKDGHTGHLVPAGSPAKLAAAIELILQNRDYASKLAENAYIFAKQQFSKEQVQQRVENDLKSVTFNKKF
jgi:glycosyltransferase involved in cell wall biosynthesis